MFCKRASGSAIHYQKLHALPLIINCNCLLLCFLYLWAFFFCRIILLSKASYVLFRPTSLAKHRQIRQDRFFAKRRSQTLGNFCWFHRTTRHSSNFDHQSKQHLGWCHRLENHAAYISLRNTRLPRLLRPTDTPDRQRAVHCSFPGRGCQYPWIGKKLWRLCNQIL